MMGRLLWHSAAANFMGATYLQSILKLEKCLLIGYSREKTMVRNLRYMFESTKIYNIGKVLQHLFGYS